MIEVLFVAGLLAAATAQATVIPLAGSTPQRVPVGADFAPVAVQAS